MPAQAETSSQRDYLVGCGGRYWPQGGEQLLALKVPEASGATCDAPLMVELPAWAVDLGVGSPAGILVHASVLLQGDGPPHERCDWWSAAHLHLTGATERAYERDHGPAHSYATRLRADPRLFDHAWVNRIFLFLRRWAAREAGGDEARLFGPLPGAELFERWAHRHGMVEQPGRSRCGHQRHNAGTAG